MHHMGRCGTTPARPHCRHRESERNTVRERETQGEGGREGERTRARARERERPVVSLCIVLARRGVVVLVKPPGGVLSTGQKAINNRRHRVRQRQRDSEKATQTGRQSRRLQGRQVDRDRDTARHRETHLVAVGVPHTRSLVASSGNRESH